MAASGHKLIAPAAGRNAAALTAMLQRVAPTSGQALEIASGTGQHITQFATALPGLNWTPTEVAADRLASIRAYGDEARLANLNPPAQLDACAAGWSCGVAPQQLIVTINLLHLISDAAAQTLLAEAAQALAPQGRLVIYGPFLRDGKTTSEGDARFHADLQSADPAIGYKDRDCVIDWGVAAGLAHRETIDMPANNLALIWSSP
jgi:SAM-dependent methyltransferase